MTGQAPTVGQPAPDFQATTVDGRTVRLSEFKGKPVWLTFGASWCQPCRAENPDVQAAYDRAKASGLEVLAVFMSEDTAAVKDYADRVGLTYDKVADPDTALASAVPDPGDPIALLHRPRRRAHADEDRRLDQAAMDQAIKDISQ